MLYPLCASAPQIGGIQPLRRFRMAGMPELAMGTGGLVSIRVDQRGQAAAGLDTRQARTRGGFKSSLPQSAEAPAKRRLTPFPS
jgi:hypothetical protein